MELNTYMYMLYTVSLNIQESDERWRARWNDISIQTVKLLTDLPQCFTCNNQPKSMSTLLIKREVLTRCDLTQPDTERQVSAKQALQKAA